MELDIDFTQPRSKMPLYVVSILLVCWMLFSTPLIDLIREYSCTYIESLQSFWYDDLGVSEESMEIWSDYAGFYILDYFLFLYLVFCSNKYFALVQVIGIKSKGVIPQVLKTVFQDTRPAWTCDNLDTAYCKASFGLPATHVWEGTVGFMTIIYFGFVHNGYFNRYPHKTWVQMLRIIGIVICVCGIEFVDQSRLVIAAHYIYQDIYGILGGMFYFYLCYYFLYPWAMDPGRRFNSLPEIFRVQVPWFLGCTFFVWMICALGNWGLVVDDEILDALFSDCTYDEDYVYSQMINFDIFFAAYVFGSIFLLVLLPLKHIIPEGHHWKWSLIGSPIFLGCTYCLTNYWMISWIPWNNSILFVTSVYGEAVFVFFFEMVMFMVFYLCFRFFTSERKTEI